ncbi:MAG: aminomethyl-transferring glycine dehydrogenase subunit GcvPA [Candidatus Bipolaricaulota bacterium]|nr:aminomethyl-transferring glycine dehydrogenase subunit GcvPA [Candidatus Bipolaricaulota bacterium]MCX7844782.1 aminomethyl-transferring glycine dehydrogenase subunit GcvPA [Candidatus Bipolaricaulota bacterium]MDW8152356.1 aminomethyl-transferring glycine dehydrogenase subunit GcvPA [Candidatus Bipolaricaulota bacterium]
MNPYIPHTERDIEAMLRAVGLPDVEALFSDIPEEVRRRFRPLGLPPRDEIWVSRYIAGLAERSTGRRLIPFLGAGLYDHYVPPLVGHILARSEFYTAYTPYQAEISQGTLTWMFEFQTMVCELTGLEVANASMYDGATALSEAVYMARRATGGSTVLVPKSLHPHVREVLATYAWAAGLRLVDVPYDEAGQIQLGEIPADTCALIVQEPNFFGVIEDLSGLKERLGKAFLIVYVNPIALGVLEPPGKFGADVVVGEGQVLGLPLSFGGPLLGLFATRMEHLRRMPGRISGRTVDAEGKEGYVMALQTREQHIRREEATSNICTNSALCALAATVYLGALGPEGLRRIALLSMERAHALAARVFALPGFRPAFRGPFLYEFAVACADAQASVERLRRHGIAVAGPALLRKCGVDNAFLVAVTEKRTPEELELFVRALAGKE